MAVDIWQQKLSRVSLISPHLSEAPISISVKCFQFKSVLKFILGQIYHFETTYHIYQSFLVPYYYQLLMNKQENETYAKPEKDVRIEYSWTKYQKPPVLIFTMINIFCHFGYKRKRWKVIKLQLNSL